MWPVTAAFKAAVLSSHKIANLVTVTPPGGAPIILPLQSGSVTLDSSARIRRTASLVLVGDSSAYATCATPGALFAITHGIDYGASKELIPVFTGEVTDSGQDFGDGSISLTLGDLANWLARVQFLTPYQPAVGLSYVTVITNVVQTARPGTVVVNTSSNTAVIATGATWSTGPLDVIADLSADGSLECFFGPDGKFYIRDVQASLAVPVWSINAGDFGTLKSAARARPTDKLYNTVVVQPSQSDGSQTWAQQVAQVTALTNPRHPNYIGVVPYFWSSPSIITAAQAQAAAQSLLSKVLGTTETLSLGAVAMCALEGNDVLRVTTPQLNTQPAVSFTHFMDGFSMDLQSGDMSNSTRSQVAS